MRVRILGGHGGVTTESQATSYLIDGHLLIDAGSVASALTIPEQSAIHHILISHAHLDHIKDLAFLCDNCFGQRPSPFEVYTNAQVKKIIEQHIFNDAIWPDFSRLPNEKNPTIRFNAAEPEKPLKLGEYTVVPVPVAHPNGAMGFIVKKGDIALLFTLDTAATDRIWEVARNFPEIKAIFTEVSFPNRLQNVANASDHHTPQTMGTELKKMPPRVPVILTHLKPNFREELTREIQELNDSRLQLLERDGQVFQF